MTTHGAGSFRSFAVLLGASILLLGTVRQFFDGEIVGTLVACVPLLIYHYRLSRLSVDRLTQTEVDSVYYFGFLITIAALAFAALAISSGNGKDQGQVVAQFAAGIVATGYAVFARQHLATRMIASDSEASGESLERQAARSREILNNLSSTAVETRLMLSALVEARKTIQEEAVRETSVALQSIVSEFTRELTASKALLGESARRLNDELERLKTAGVGSLLAESFERLAKATGVLEQGVIRTAAASVEAATGLGMIAEEATVARQSLAGITDAASQLAPLRDSFMKLGQAVSESTRSTVEASRDIRSALEGITDMGELVSAAPRSLKRLVDQTARVADGVDHMTETAERLSSATAGLEKLSASGAAAHAAMTNVSERIPAALDSIEQLGRSAAGTRQELTSLGGVIANVSESSKAMSSLAKEAARASTSMSSYQEALGEVGKRLASIGQDVEGAALRVAGSAEMLSGVTEATATQVKSDLAVASAGATEVSRRLVELVDSLIEATARQRRAP